MHIDGVFAWMLSGYLHFSTSFLSLRIWGEFCVAGICRGLQILLFTFYFDFFLILWLIFSKALGVSRSMTKIRYDTHAMDHSTALKRNEGMNWMSGLQDWRAFFFFWSSLLFQFAFCSKAIYIWGDAFLFAPAFLFGGFRLQSGVRGGFSFTPKIELDWNSTMIRQRNQGKRKKGSKEGNQKQALWWHWWW